MKPTFLLLLITSLLLTAGYPTFSQESKAMPQTSSAAAVGLDLVAFGELFKGSENLQAFERAVNLSENGVNNLDLDENGEVDFIRIIEEVSDDTHLIVAQVPLEEGEVQDVASIEIEKQNETQYNLQIRGNETIYGADYFVVPAEVDVYGWPIVGLLYRPAYRPYRSAFAFGLYPRWYHPFRPVSPTIYHTRTVRLTARTTFAITRTPRLKSATRIHYTARNSRLVKSRTTVTHTRGGKTTVTRSTTVKPRGGRRRP